MDFTPILSLDLLNDSAKSLRNELCRRALAALSPEGCSLGNRIRAEEEEKVGDE